MARSALMTVMMKAADKAARGLKRDFGELENLQVSRKGLGDFVSVADKKAEDAIYAELSKARPDFGFLGEEGGKQGNPNAESRWIVDPLDGTTNFLHGIPHWAISIACEQKGEIIAGLVYDPIKDEMFYAEKGAGVYLNSRRLRVSARREMGEALVATGITARYTEHHDAWMEQAKAVVPAAGGVRRMGAAALDLAYVAAGRYDGFWENICHPWDVAAGVLLVSEAAGQVSHLNGKKYVLGSTDIVATNGLLHAPLLKLISPKKTVKAAG